MDGLEVIVYLVLLVAFWIYRGIKSAKRKRQQAERRMHSEGVEEYTVTPAEEPSQSSKQPTSFEEMFEEIFQEPKRPREEPVQQEPELTLKPAPEFKPKKEEPIKAVQKEIYVDYTKGTPKATDLTKKVTHASDLSKKLKHAADLSKEIKHARDLKKDDYHAIDRSKLNKRKKFRFNLRQAVINQVILERPYK